MLPLIIICPIKTGSLANWCKSISCRDRTVIIIKRHNVIGSLIMLVPSFPPLLGQFLIRVTVFT
jgi:hypothetical protein